MKQDVLKLEFSDVNAFKVHEVSRLCALAMTEIETAAMWAVKAATA